MTRDEINAAAEALRIKHNLPKPFSDEWYAARDAIAEAKWQAHKHLYVAFDKTNTDTWPVGPKRRDDWDKPDYETITYVGERRATGHFGE